MNRNQEPADREIEQMLAGLRSSYPPRQSQAARQARTRFLQEVETLRQSADARGHRTVAGRVGQLFGWRMEDRRMSRVIVVIALVIAVTLGGAGLTVSAAQGALPQQSLYPIKLFTESVRTAVTLSDVQAAELQVTFAVERADEVLVLAQQGDYAALGEAVERLDGQLEKATEAIEELQETNPEEAARLAATLESKLAEVTAALEQLPLAGAPEKARETAGEAIEVTTDAQQEIHKLLGEQVPEVEKEPDEDLVEEKDEAEAPEIEESKDDAEVDEDEVDEIEDDDAEDRDEKINDSAEVDEHEEEKPAIVSDEHQETEHSSEHQERAESGHSSEEHEREESDD